VTGPSAARRPRRHDAEASRAALLAAAAALFEERGYDAATVREIGERAGVDAALIARYFGGKEGLYLASMESERRPPLPADPAELVAAILTRSEERGIGPVALAMVNPALSQAMRDEVRRILDGRVVAPLAAALDAEGVEDARLRAELLVALAVGLSVTRAGGTLPRLRRASVARLTRILAPAVEALKRPVRAR
jgi:AcrR family transcriptional regulator